MPLPKLDNNLPSASRFTILPEFNNEAVRDNNTGTGMGACTQWQRHVDGSDPALSSKASRGHDGLAAAVDRGTQ